MRTVSKFLFLLTSLALATACKKEVEKIVVQQVDKTYSWSEAKQLYGTDRIILGMAKDANTVYLQVPNALGILSPAKSYPTYRQYYTSASAAMPSDINLRIPITADFFARPYLGANVVVSSTKDPVNGGANAAIVLRQLDSRASGVATNYLSFAKFGAFSRNNFLLFGYETDLGQADPQLHFVLASVRLVAGQVQVQPQVLNIPRTFRYRSSYIRMLTAIDDYFLADCGDEGIYKIRENGVLNRVYQPAIVDTFYKWQGTLYALEEYNILLSSTDDGTTWQRRADAPGIFAFTTYHVIGDSLVGITHGFGGNTLFTLRWNSSNYRVRLLKNDGLEQASVSGLEQLGDTVYIGTTSGLFKRPLNKFFESKP